MRMRMRMRIYYVYTTYIIITDGGRTNIAILIYVKLI
jgi:hypothetical protein